MSSSDSDDEEPLSAMELEVDSDDSSDTDDEKDQEPQPVIVKNEPKEETKQLTEKEKYKLFMKQIAPPKKKRVGGVDKKESEKVQEMEEHNIVNILI